MLQALCSLILIYTGPKDTYRYERCFNPLLYRYSFLTHQQETAFENIVGKGEIAHNQKGALTLYSIDTRF